MSQEDKHWSLKKQKIHVTLSDFEQIYPILQKKIFQQLNNDLKFIKSQKDIPNLAHLKHTLIQNQPSPDNKFLSLFIQFPEKSGFLLEPNDYKIELYNATKTAQYLTNNSNEFFKQELLVVKSKNIETFQVLDENYVRNSYGTTLSVEALSEFLLLG